MLTKFLPLPANSGGKQRSSAVLKHLAELGEVTICAFDDKDADHDAFGEIGVKVRAIPRRGILDFPLGVIFTKSISAARFWSRAYVRALNEIFAEEEPDCILVSYAQLAPYIHSLPARHRLLDLHNVESALFKSYASSSKGIRSLYSRIESAAMSRIERDALRSFDVISVVSKQDAERLEEMWGGKQGPKLLTCPNGWDPSPPLPIGKELVVVFVGLMGWAPNADAAVWLVQMVWPHVRIAIPGARLYIVGRDPTVAVRNLADEDIVVTGTVPEVRPYLEMARCAVAPLRAGGGSRLKILAALNAGRPVVATTTGAEGLEQFQEHGLLIEDDPGSFANSLIDLLSDAKRAEELGKLGNEAISDHYSWDATLAPMMGVLNEFEHQPPE